MVSCMRTLRFFWWKVIYQNKPQIHAKIQHTSYTTMRVYVHDIFGIWYFNKTETDHKKSKILFCPQMSNKLKIEVTLCVDFIYGDAQCSVFTVRCSMFITQELIQFLKGEANLCWVIEWMWFCIQSQFILYEIPAFNILLLCIHIVSFGCYFSEAKPKQVKMILNKPTSLVYNVYEWHYYMNLLIILWMESIFSI